MAESILFGLADSLLGKLGSLAVEEIGLALDAKNDLNKLTRTLATIQVVLLDAEHQQATNHKLRIWLEALKDVCSSAENVLDELKILALRRQVMQKCSLTEKVQNFFSSSNPIVFNVKMGHKIKEIRLALDDIAKEKNDYNLSELQSVDRRVSHVWRETHSRLNSGDAIIGRDRDEKVIIDHLLQVDKRKHVSVISLVGIAGLGKTALAKAVFNDMRVIQHFEFMKWVCVAEDFDVKKIICNITKCGESSLENMVEHLEKSLKGKRYLLVLDDVWNEDARKWEGLMELLMCGANGSKIVTTTRSPLVASIAQSTYTHILEGLSDEDSLDLLMKHAFGQGQSKRYSYLEEFGKDIARKCRGVPLALRTSGSRLNMKTEVREWRSVRDSEVWSLDQGEWEILPALKLSYDALPPYLKQCFVVCSMYKKDHEFNSMSVIYLWMALGLLERGKNLEVEEIGKQYLSELFSRSFFQDYWESDYKDRFKMHDLMHDLAISLTRSECASVQHNSTNHALIHPKFISFDDKRSVSGEKIPELILEANDLRMIRAGYCDDIGSVSDQYFLNTCFSKFKFLRVLDLKNLSFDVLPNSVGGLKHLRYLELLLAMELLPNSLCRLLSLQYLRLKNNGKGFERLPKSVSDLISLRYLEVGTNESCFPAKGVGSLTSLRSLIVEHCKNMKYLFDDNDYEKIGGMQQNLPNLRTLVIKHCPKLVGLPRCLKHLTRLETLKIENCKELDLMKDSSSGKDECLVNLQVLVISRLPKLVEFPPWLTQSGAASTCLKKLIIRECDRLTKFPKDLRYLQKLVVADCPRLTSLSEGSNPLAPTLKELVIIDCTHLIARYTTAEERHKTSHIPQVIFRDHRAIKEKIKTQLLVNNAALQFISTMGAANAPLKREVSEL